MKKLSLYVFLVLMFCDIAYAMTPIDTLVTSVIMTILATVFTSMFKINPLFPFGVIFGIPLFITVLLFIGFLKNFISPKKKRKKLKKEGVPVDTWHVQILFYGPPILVLGGLLIFR